MNHPPGSPITTPTGRQGVIVVPDGGDLLPLYALIELDNGEKQWFLASILTPATPSPSTGRSRRKRVQG